MSNEWLQKKYYVVIDLRQGGDWALDLCFAGLNKNLDRGQVIDWPTKTKHREWTSYQETDWGKERRTLGYCGELGPGISEESLRNLIEKNMVGGIFLDEREESYLEYKRLGFIGSDIPVHVISCHDRFWNSTPMVLLNYYGKNLKSFFYDHPMPDSVLKNFPKTVKTGVCSLSTNFDHFWDQQRGREKIYDLSFNGYNSHPDREKYIKHIERNWSGRIKTNLMLETRPDTIENFFPKNEYFRIMDQSKICLNLKGASVAGRSLRFWEIPYVGSCMLSQHVEYDMSRPNLIDKLDYYSFRSEYELDSLIEKLLSDDELREKTAKNGHDLVIENHSVKSRWKQIIDTIGVV